MTFRDLCEQWLSVADLRATSRAWYRSTLERLVYPTLGALRVDRVSPQRIESLYRSLGGAKASQAHRAIRRVNPCGLIALPKTPLTVTVTGEAMASHRNLGREQHEAVCENTRDDCLNALRVRAPAQALKTAMILATCDWALAGGAREGASSDRDG